MIIVSLPRHDSFIAVALYLHSQYGLSRIIQQAQKNGSLAFYDS
jgi:hypothetical protein